MANAKNPLQAGELSNPAAEVTKTRRVVVLSPRNRDTFPGTYLVVPISKTTPSPPGPQHCLFLPRLYYFFDAVEPVWAKADRLTCVSWKRLDRLKVNGRFAPARLRKEHLAAVRQAVLHAMGMGTWQEVEQALVPSQLPSP